MKLVEAGTFTCLECKSIIGKEDFLTKIKVKTPKREKKERKKLKKRKTRRRKIDKKEKEYEEEYEEENRMRRLEDGYEGMAEF